MKKMGNMSHRDGYWSSCLQGLLAVSVNTQTVKFRIFTSHLEVWGDGVVGDSSLCRARRGCVCNVSCHDCPLFMNCKLRQKLQWYCLILSLHFFLCGNSKKLLFLNIYTVPQLYGNSIRVLVNCGCRFPTWKGGVLCRL